MVPPSKRIEELTRENGMLRQELAHYKEAHYILLNFLHISRRLYKGMKSSLDDTFRGLSIAEQPIEDLLNIEGGRKDEA